jgi:hypothetical protein
LGVQDIPLKGRKEVYMFENNFLPFSQSKNECFLALDNLPEGNNGMGWDGMGRWRVWVSSSTTVFLFFFLGFKITIPIPLNSSFHI